MLKGKMIMCLCSLTLMVNTYCTNPLSPFQYVAKAESNNLLHTDKFGMIINPIYEQLQADKIKYEKLKAEQIQQEESKTVEIKRPTIQYIEFELTFYTALPDENGFGAITCQGKPLRAGIVANNVLSLGTVIDLQGYGAVTVADRGGKSFNSSTRLDVYVAKQSGESNSQYKKRVLKMGRQIVKGKIIKNS